MHEFPQGIPIRSWHLSGKARCNHNCGDNREIRSMWKEEAIPRTQRKLMQVQGKETKWKCR